MKNEINVAELLKRILEEEEFVKSSIINYQEYLPEFITNALEDVENIEAKVLVLEKEPTNTDAINSLFRSFHNIKGSSSFVGQEIIKDVAHQTETLMDGCRKGITELDREILDLILRSSDYIKLICNEISLNEDEKFSNEVFNHIKKIKEKISNKCDQPDMVVISAADDIHLEFLNDFVLDTKEHINSIEVNVVELEKNLQDIDIMNMIYRDFHSIKGLSGFTGQLLVQRLAHETENLLDSCRKGHIDANKNIINLTLKTVDIIKNLCSDFSLSNDHEFLHDIYLHLQNINNEDKIIEIQAETEEPVDSEFLEDFILETKEHIESIEMNVLILEKEPENTEIIHTMFRSFHTIKGLAGFVDQNLVQQIAHKTETLMDGCRKSTIKVNKTIIDLILKSSDYIKKICEDVQITKNREFITEVSAHLDEVELYESRNVSCDDASKQTEPVKKIGEILVEQKVIKAQDVEDILKKQQSEYKDLKFGQVVVKEEKAKPKDILDALKRQQVKQSPAEEYMRISTSKVDNLVDMVGELIITQSLVEQRVATKLGVDTSLNVNFRRLTRITKDLQNLSMFLRMVSLKSTFQKITRVARDTINELGKDIDFTTSGDETEIDRIVTEKLLDPLVHLVKNSISHGIESKEERIKRGKSPQGNVKVLAYNKRGSIFIEVVDDGNGIDIQKVYSKALEKNLIDPSKNYSDREIQEFILLPGFSTLDVANNISGRGVGMDVVKTEISKIGGKIDIDNRPGEGCTFTLKIPVNHAVMNGTIIDIDGSNYIIPTINVKKILQPLEDQWVSTQGYKSMIKVRNDIIPVISIAKIFRINPDEKNLKLIVILEIDQRFRALPVRNIIGRQEIVVKPVCDEFSGLRYISGMSILGDGKVSLILDVEHLFQTEGAH